MRLELHGELGDLHFEVVDQLQADVDVAPPWVGDLKAVEQLAAGETEEVGDRARVTEGDQRRVDAVLQRGAMAHRVQPEPGQLALTADARVGQPDRRHQIAPRQLGQHPGVDAVGLASQRRQPLDPLRVGEHVPAVLLERVVHQPRAVHRLDHRTHPTTSQSPGQAAHAIGVRRHRPLGHHLAVPVEQPDIEPTSTQIQSSVQHQRGPPRARSSMTRRACHRGDPLSSQSKAKASPSRWPTFSSVAGRCP
jgi:hypothetical protein